MAVEFGVAGVFRKAIVGGLFPGGWKDIPEEERKSPFVRRVARKMRLCGTPRKLRLGFRSRARLFPWIRCLRLGASSGSCPKRPDQGLRSASATRAGMQRLRKRQSSCPNQSFRSLLVWLCSESGTRRNLEFASECDVSFIERGRGASVVGPRRRKRPSLAECLVFRNNSDSSTRLHRHPIAQCHPKKHPVENNIETQIKRAIHRKTQRNTKDPQTCNPYCIRLRPSSEISS